MVGYLAAQEEYDMAFKTFKDGTVVETAKFEQLVKENVQAGLSNPAHRALFVTKKPDSLSYDTPTFLEAFDDFMDTLSEAVRKELDEEPSVNVAGAGTGVAGLNDGIPYGKKKPDGDPAPILTRDVSPEENSKKKSFKDFAKEIKEANYNRGDIQSTLATASKTAKSKSVAQFVGSTAFGYFIDDSPPPFNRDYYKVDPNGEVYLFTYDHPTAIWSQSKIN